MDNELGQAPDMQAPDHPAKTPPGTHRSSRIGQLEWAVIALAAAVALVPEAAIAIRSLREPSLTWTGAIGGNVAEDAQQYIAWVIEASHHVLIGNLFTLAPPQRVFLHPAIAISGALNAAGVPAAVAHAAWVPVALVALVAGSVATCHAFLSGASERAAALATALFFAFPPVLNRALLAAGSPGSRGLSATSIDSAAIVSMWGYPLSVIAFALLPIGLLAHARARLTGTGFSPMAAGCLLASAWLQPWQGLVAAATVIGLECALRAGQTAERLAPRARPGGLQLCAAGSLAALLPVIGYAVLGATDPSFAATGPNTAWVASTESWWTVLLAVLPLVAFAAFGFRPPRDATPADLMLRIWPAASLTTALAMSLTGIDAQSSHALRGISIPLAVLAVLGWRRVSNGGGSLGRAFTAAAAVSSVIFMVAATVERSVAQARTVTVGPPAKGFFIGPEDASALEWLRHAPASGGVVAAGALGPLVPAMAGRQVWNGHWNWSPHADARRTAVRAAVSGGRAQHASLLGMDPGRFLAATGARFALLGCGSATPTAIARIATGGEAVRRFGCAAVIGLNPASNRDIERVAARYGDRPARPRR